MKGRTRTTRQGTSSTKQKKSFTLSRSSVAFLERLRKEGKGASTSLILDELIRRAEAIERHKSTEQAISDYYSSLTADEKSEGEAWGKFALAQLREENPGA